jgi:hypothetical protein
MFEAESLVGLAKLVELLEQSARSSPGEPNVLLRHLADERWTAKADGSVCRSNKVDAFDRKVLEMGLGRHRSRNHRHSARPRNAPGPAFWPV